jgi:hypothetical protein
MESYRIRVPFAADPTSSWDSNRRRKRLKVAASSVRSLVESHKFGGPPTVMTWIMYMCAWLCVCANIYKYMYITVYIYIYVYNIHYPLSIESIGLFGCTSWVLMFMRLYMSIAKSTSISLQTWCQMGLMLHVHKSLATDFCTNLVQFSTQVLACLICDNCCNHSESPCFWVCWSFQHT